MRVLPFPKGELKRFLLKKEFSHIRKVGVLAKNSERVGEGFVRMECANDPARIGKDDE